MVSLTAGVHAVEWVWFEHVGQASGELFAAPGALGGFNSQFMVLGDQRLFGLVPGAAPSISVKRSAGDDVDPTSGIDFGYTSKTHGGTQSFVVTNNGNADLTGLGISIDGADSALFSVVAPPVAPVPPGGSTTFSVQFWPGSDGAKTAALHLDSNDPHSNPFNFPLSGAGVTALQAWRQQYFGTIDGAGAAADDANPFGGGPNLLAFAFGTDPTADSTQAMVISGNSIVHYGTPVAMVANGVTGPNCTAVFGRRDDYAAAGVTYTVQFSADLGSWESSSAIPAVLADDGSVQAVSVPFPSVLGSGQQPHFFRINVTTGP